MNPDQLDELLLETVRKLGEHFDAVQIHASTVGDNGKTTRFSQGIGNWYARQGMAQEFINEDKAADQARLIAKAIDEEKD